MALNRIANPRTRSKANLRAQKASATTARATTPLPVSSAAEAVVGDVLRFLMPSVFSGHKPVWPPDAFALAASILKRSDAYVEVANRWPPPKYRAKGAWHKRIAKIAADWRRQYAKGGRWPRQLDGWWSAILTRSNYPLNKVAASRELVVALVGIVAASDHACFGLGRFRPQNVGDAVDDWAVRNLALYQNLCDSIHRSRVAVLPKSHNPLMGITLRSLTHNLALWDHPEVSASWQTSPAEARLAMNVLLLPWPLKTSANAFQPMRRDGGLALPDGMHLFTYDVPSPINVGRVKGLIDDATELAGPIDMIVFPELCMTERDFRRIIEGCDGRGTIVGGLATSPGTRHLGINAAAVVVPPNDVAVVQGKHHRWRLDRNQIDQYGIGHSLNANDVWWEAIKVAARRCNFFANDWMTFCVLICEDLARQDPVAELVRSVGPSLVIALLLDGPQVPDRWPARYATVLAEDPRSSVLTLTSAGLVDLARSQYGGGPRSIGLWKDALSGVRQIILEPSAEGVLLRLSTELRTEWTADGRHNAPGTGYLRLTGISQIGTTMRAGNEAAVVVR